MSMIFCPACKKQISAQANQCPNCGQPIDETATGPEAQRSAALSKVGYVVLGTAFMVILGFIVRWLILQAL